MRRILLVATLFSVLAGLTGCGKTYPAPKPTQPVMPASVSWGTEEPAQEDK